MTEVERMARLLCRARYLWLAHSGQINKPSPAVEAAFVETNWAGHEYEALSRELAAAGLAILPREPREATIDAMAAQIISENLNIMIEVARAFFASVDEEHREMRELGRRMARAAYRAAVEGGE